MKTGPAPCSSAEKLRRVFSPSGPFPPWARFREGTERKSAVLVPFFPAEEGVRLLFLRRSSLLTHHAGEICFPGGMREEEDESPLATALRETEEETAIPPSAVEPLRFLPVEHSVVTSIAVFPVAGIVSGVSPETILLSPGEIDEFRFAEIDSFPAVPEKERVLLKGVPHIYPVYSLDNGWRIWGVTARILENVLRLWKGEEPPWHS
ncbi:MAG: CoA pyrophosphatase [Synergistaceae bacterium]|nr:CoA pyrophosphatase [Synergistaceae bacterium]